MDNRNQKLNTKFSHTAKQRNTNVGRHSPQNYRLKDTKYTPQTLVKLTNAKDSSHRYQVHQNQHCILQ